MGGGPDNVKDACISESDKLRLTVARLPDGASSSRLSRASPALPVVVPGMRDLRLTSCDSAHRCIFRDRTRLACDAAANCHACAVFLIDQQ